jgi:hypothetical protein
MTLCVWKNKGSQLVSSNLKTHYHKHKDEVLQRIRKYQKHKLELAQIGMLHELQQEKLLDLRTGDITKDEYDKLVGKMNNKLDHLHLVS